MTRDEFARWLEDLRCRLPDTHRWLAGASGTAKIWYDDVFAELEYDLATSALGHVWKEGLPAYDREKLPAIISRKVQEIRYRRKQTADRVAARKYNASGFYSDNPPKYIVGMRECLREYLLVRKSGVKGPSFVDQWFDRKEEDPARCGSAEEYISRHG